MRSFLTDVSSASDGFGRQAGSGPVGEPKDLQNIVPIRAPMLREFPAVVNQKSKQNSGRVPWGLAGMVLSRLACQNPSDAEN